MSDWIKVEKSTSTKPEVLHLAELLKIQPAHAFGLCVKFWSWCDDHIEDGHARNVTFFGLSSAIGHKGFAEAMAKVGWIKAENEGFMIPNFERHLSHSAKKRSADAQRKQTERVNKSSDKCHNGNGQKMDEHRTRSDTDQIRSDQKRNSVNTEQKPEGQSLPQLESENRLPDCTGIENSLGTNTPEQRLSQRLRSKAGYGGNDGRCFDKAAAMVARNLIGEADAMEAAEDAAKGKDPPALFVAIMRKKYPEAFPKRSK